MTTPAVVAPDLVAVAEKFADVTVDTRGRKSFDFDDHGIAAFAAALAPAQTQGDAEPAGFLAYQIDDEKPRFFPSMTVLNEGTKQWHPPVGRIVPLYATPRAVPESAAPTQPSDGDHSGRFDEADAFERLCREHDILGTAAARQCEVFWRAGARFAALTQAWPGTAGAVPESPVPTQPSEFVQTFPDHIWLDAGEAMEFAEKGDTFRDLQEVTWSEDNATGFGVKYIRADLATPAATQAGAEALTDEQIVILRRETLLEAHQPRASDLAFARAIERAHGITESAVEPIDDSDHAEGVLQAKYCNEVAAAVERVTPEMIAQQDAMEEMAAGIGDRLDAHRAAAVEPAKVVMTPMTFDDGRKGWYIRTPDFYLDIEHDSDGKWSAFFRDSNGSEAFADQAATPALDAAAVPAPVDERLERVKAAHLHLADMHEGYGRNHDKTMAARVAFYAELESLAALPQSPRAAEPECSKCYGHRFVEEGDPETGGNKVPCACNDLAQPDAKDAARYRHLRNLAIAQTGMPGQPCIALPNGMKSGYYLTEETADHAVDKSIAAAQEAQQS